MTSSSACGAVACGGSREPALVEGLLDLKAWLSAQHGLFQGAEWLTNAVAVVVLTALAAIAWGLLRLLLGRAAVRIESWTGVHVRALRYQSQEILSAHDTLGVVLGTLRWLGYGLHALLIYVYLNGVAGLFASTAGLAERMLGTLIDAVWTLATAFADYLPSLLMLLLLGLVARWSVRVLELIFNGIGRGRVVIAGFDPEWASPTFKIVRALALIVFLIMAFPYFPGSSSAAFQGVSIFVGVLVSLGSSGAVANLIAGMVLTYTRAFRIGDRVRIADATGDVLEKTLLVTRIRTPKNAEITIPNAMVLSNHVINWSTQAEQDGIALHTTVTIGYDVPWQRVDALLMEAARATTDILEAPAPFVLQTALGDFYVHYELNAYTRQATRMLAIYSELHRNIQERFHAAGIEIASPHLSAARDGNQLQIPEDHLPRDYQPGGFRLLPLPGTGTLRREGGDP